MNYKDILLENKEFNFFKQLIYNIAMAICILLLFGIVMVYGFKFQLYNVLSDSEEPYFTSGDMIIVKQQKSYEVGDILKFNYKGAPVTHRLVAIKEHNGTTYYYCHGDAVQNTDGSYDHIGDYKWEINRLKDMTYAEMNSDEVKNVQQIELSAIDGSVVGTLKNYGEYFNFIKSHTALIIALIVSIWCISGVITNEIEMKKSRRLLTK